MANTRSKTNNKMIDNQSGTRIASSEDLISDILFRLPVTSILRFKSWRLLLTHRHFTNRYDNINFPNAPGLFARTYLTHPSKSLAHLAGDIYVSYGIENRTAPPFTSFDFYFNRSGVRIEQSCNGLLLCSVFHNGAREYYVFNPTTKQLALVPPVPVVESAGKSNNICSMALAFHQTNCVRYKVVCIRALEPDGDLNHLIQIQVYSSDTRKWKICAVSAQNPKFHDPVYWNGAVYWASCYQHNLFYFKLDDEELRLVSLPVEMMAYETTSIMYLGESRGHLHLIFYTDGEDYVLRVNVYEMLRDHSGWFVKYRLRLNELLRDFPCLITQYERPGAFDEMEHPYQCDFQVVDVVRGKEEEDTFLVLLTPRKIIWYNVHDKSFKELYHRNNYFVHFSGFHRYMETVFSF